MKNILKKYYNYYKTDIHWLMQAVAYTSIAGIALSFLLFLCTNNKGGLDSEYALKQVNFAIFSVQDAAVRPGEHMTPGSSFFVNPNEARSAWRSFQNLTKILFVTLVKDGVQVGDVTTHEQYYSAVNSTSIQRVQDEMDDLRDRRDRYAKSTNGIFFVLIVSQIFNTIFSVRLMVLDHNKSK